MGNKRKGNKRLFLPEVPLSSIMKNQYIQHSCYSNQPMATQMPRETISLYFLLGNERLMLEIVLILVR